MVKSNNDNIRHEWLVIHEALSRIINRQRADFGNLEYEVRRFLPDYIRDMAVNERQALGDFLMEIRESAEADFFRRRDHSGTEFIRRARQRRVYEAARLALN